MSIVIQHIPADQVTKNKFWVKQADGSHRLGFQSTPLTAEEKHFVKQGAEIPSFGFICIVAPYETGNPSANVWVAGYAIKIGNEVHSILEETLECPLIYAKSWVELMATSFWIRNIRKIADVLQMGEVEE